MDIEKIFHHKHSNKERIVIAFVLSAMVVTFFSLVARGAVNLKGSLTNPSANPDLVAIVKAEEILGPNQHVLNVQHVRDHEQEKIYDLVLTVVPRIDSTDQSSYFMTIAYNKDRGTWESRKFEHLHNEVN